MKSKAAYVRQAFAFADSWARPIASLCSQAVFRRSDSSWANDLKVTFDDLASEWPDDSVRLCHPYTTIGLDKPANSSRTLPSAAARPRGRRRGESRGARSGGTYICSARRLRRTTFCLFRWNATVALLYHRGIGWRLCTSGTERFYNSRTRTLERRIPEAYDIIVTLPDQVLYEALQNDILTDLGITMIIRVDTRIDLRRTYGFFC